MTKHAFLAYAVREQKTKPRSMKLHSFIILEEFPPDTEGQKTAPLPSDKIMDIIYHSIPTM